MDVVGVMAAYLHVVRVCTAQSREALCVLHCLERHSIKLSDDGSLVIRNVLEQFEIFLNIL